MINYVIEIPKGDFDKNQFAKFCERFNCKVLKDKRGSASFRVESVNPVNFFWLGCNINFKYDSGMAISASSELLK